MCEITTIKIIYRLHVIRREYDIKEKLCWNESQCRESFLECISMIRVVSIMRGRAHSNPSIRVNFVIKGFLQRHRFLSKYLCILLSKLGIIKFKSDYR